STKDVTQLRHLQNQQSTEDSSAGCSKLGRMRWSSWAATGVFNSSTATWRGSSATNVRRPRRTPGEGSIFSAILPRVMTMAPADHLVPVMGPRAGSRTILVVIDDAAALKLADAAVRELGCR